MICVYIYVICINIVSILHLLPLLLFYSINFAFHIISCFDFSIAALG